MKDGLVWILIAFLVACFSVTTWKAERWLNWKFSYQDRMEQGIRQLEKRIQALEDRSSDDGAKSVTSTDN